MFLEALLDRGDAAGLRLRRAPGGLREHRQDVLDLLGDEDKTATVSKPLAAKAKTVVKLPKLKGCTVAVQATFEKEGLVEVGEFDVCKEKTIRFTD